MHEGDIPLIAVRQKMAQVGQIARKGMNDKTLMFAPLRGSKAPVAPSESAIPNGMSEFLNYVHVHNGEKNKLTRKVGEEGWVATVTVNFFSFKNMRLTPGKTIRLEIPF